MDERPAADCFRPKTGTLEQTLTLPGEIRIGDKDFSGREANEIGKCDDEV